jgi:CRISPR-associated protein Cmr6
MVAPSISAAVPERIAKAYATARGECAPGHAFNLFFEVWNTQKWEMSNNVKAEALKDVFSLSPYPAKMLNAMVARQECMRNLLGPEQITSIYALATSPFTTGLGIEHPLENGFAFLSPYGLPYLAGSGVKGMLRKAAEDSEELNPEQVEHLFGTDNQASGFASLQPGELKRGVLTFWDVFPTPDQGSQALFRVEIMTPHHSDYLQKRGTPNDSESPIPIPFLAIRPGSQFVFTVTCQTNRLDEKKLPKPWKEIVDSLFDDAFVRLGFGAKTAVGYGALKRMGTSAINEQKQKSSMAEKRCSWVDEKISEISKKPGIALKDVLVGRKLAEEWNEISDEEIKATALADIKARWGEQWNGKLSGARKIARAIYGEDPS